MTLDVGEGGERVEQWDEEDDEMGEAMCGKDEGRRQEMRCLDRTAKQRSDYGDGAGGREISARVRYTYGLKKVTLKPEADCF